MAQVCGKCKAYDAESALVTCPTCNLPMQFTLLPPPGQGTAPLPVAESEPRPGPRRPNTAEQGHHIMDQLGWLFRSRIIASLVVIPLLTAAGGFFVEQAVVGDPQKRQLDPFQIGTKYNEVQNSLQQPAPTPGFQPASNPALSPPMMPSQQPAFTTTPAPPIRPPQQPAIPMANSGNIRRNPTRP
jgi:hypothetical protein